MAPMSDYDTIENDDSTTEVSADSLVWFAEIPEHLTERKDA